MAQTDIFIATAIVLWLDGLRLLKCIENAQKIWSARNCIEIAFRGSFN